MRQSERELWIERIARALAELKKAPAEQVPAGAARETPQQPAQGKGA
jgi:hypothetical protein